MPPPQKEGDQGLISGGGGGIGGLPLDSHEMLAPNNFSPKSLWNTLETMNFFRVLFGYGMLRKTKILLPFGWKASSIWSIHLIESEVLPVLIAWLCVEVGVLKKTIYTYIYIYFGLSPCPVTVTTRIIIFLVGDPYKPSFATVTGRGDNPIYTI